MAKFVTLVGLIASLNLALFVFNLIPPLLDGGHVAGALWEGLKRQSARLLNRPDPGYVDAKALPVAYAVSSVLIVMSVLLIYADIVKPIRLGGRPFPPRLRRAPRFRAVRRGSCRVEVCAASRGFSPRAEVCAASWFRAARRGSTPRRRRAGSAGADSRSASWGYFS